MNHGRLYANGPIKHSQSLVLESCMGRKTSPLRMVGVGNAVAVSSPRRERTVTRSLVTGGTVRQSFWRLRRSRHETAQPTRWQLLFIGPLGRAAVHRATSARRKRRDAICVPSGHLQRPSATFDLMNHETHVASPLGIADMLQELCLELCSSAERWPSPRPVCHRPTDM